jgi:hypothetical protein
MVVKVQVDTTNALARFGAQGMPVFVRNELRRVIPGLTRRLAAQVNANLDAGLKTRRRLVVKQEMVENPQAIYGRVTTVSTEEPYMLPEWLEDGTEPHVIRARSAGALAFFWSKLGKNVMFKQVNHPGFAGIHYTQNAFNAMESEIRRTINSIIKDALGAR